MIPELAQCAKSILACWANAHGCVWLHHYSGATGLTGTVNHISHKVQTGLKEQTVISGKQLLIHELFHLKQRQTGKESRVGANGRISWTLIELTHTCDGVAKEVHLGSGQLRHWTLPSRIWIWKYSVMQALQYTCWHSLKQRQFEPSFSTKQIPQQNTLLSNTLCRCASSKSRSWGRRSARGSIKRTVLGSSWEDDENFCSDLEFINSFFFSSAFSGWPPNCTIAKTKKQNLHHL